MNVRLQPGGIQRVPLPASYQAAGWTIGDLSRLSTGGLEGLETQRQGHRHGAGPLPGGQQPQLNWLDNVHWTPQRDIAPSVDITIN